MQSEIRRNLAQRRRPRQSTRPLPGSIGCGKMPAMRAVMLTSAALLAGCLFEGDPECFPGEEATRCGPRMICVERACVPDPDAPAPDAAPPPRDAIASDAAPADGSTPDMDPDAPCRPAAETCDGTDEDCDRRIDEAIAGCGTYPEECGWIERGAHLYLICPEPLAQDAANRLCAAVGDMQLAFTESCEEADWLGFSGQAVAAYFGWFVDGSPRESTRGWWLDLGFRVPGDEGTIFRFGQGAIGETRCWNDGEPNNLLFGGEPCVNLLESNDDGAEYLHGWNDDACNANPENHVGTICELPCAPGTDADEDGVDACADCDDDDPAAPGEDAIGNCPFPFADFEPAEGLPRP